MLHISLFDYVGILELNNKLTNKINIYIQNPKSSKTTASKPSQEIDDSSKGFSESNRRPNFISIWEKERIESKDYVPPI